MKLLAPIREFSRTPFAEYQGLCHSQSLPPRRQGGLGMTLLSMIRTGYKYWRGQRPRVEDMDRIAIYMRKRLERGLPAVPTSLGGRMRGLGGGRTGRQLRELQTRKLRRTVEYVYRYA